jgi:hypothetical protein
MGLAASKGYVDKTKPAQMPDQIGLDLLIKVGQSAVLLIISGSWPSNADTHLNKFCLR